MTWIVCFEINQRNHEQARLILSGKTITLEQMASADLFINGLLGNQVCRFYTILLSQSFNSLNPNCIPKKSKIHQFLFFSYHLKLLKFFYTNRFQSSLQLIKLDDLWCPLFTKVFVRGIQSYHVMQTTKLLQRIRLTKELQISDCFLHCFWLDDVFWNQHSACVWVDLMRNGFLSWLCCWLRPKQDTKAISHHLGQNW